MSSYNFCEERNAKVDSKTCATTGKSVIDVLMAEGLLTPMTDKAFALSRDEKVARIQELMAEFLDVMGYDRTDPELIDTPRRIAKMYVDELLTAHDPAKFPKCTSFETKGKDASFADEMVIERDIFSAALCSHHFLPYDFVCDVGYVANERMLGISKLVRIVQQLSSTASSQETLGKAIARAIQLVAGVKDVIVQIEGSHACQRIRGAKSRARTVTLAGTGRFGERNSELRKEFLSAIGSERREIL
jgi:GTP cyclohydrolase I